MRQPRTYEGCQSSALPGILPLTSGAFLWTSNTPLVFHQTVNVVGGYGVVEHAEPKSLLGSKSQWEGSAADPGRI